jgi:type IV fimbrial biogenesis protein FimT
MNKRTQSAFTLMELLVVLSIAGLILALTIPNLQSFMKNNKMTGVANDLLTSLTLARNEAIKLQAPVAVCASANPKTANPACVTGTFSSGWIVWIDANNNGLHDNGETVISAHDALDPVISSGADNAYLVSYAATGFAQPSAGGRVATTQVAMCDDRHNVNTMGSNQLSAARAVTINTTGRARVTRIVSEIATVITNIGTFGNCS